MQQENLLASADGETYTLGNRANAMRAYPLEGR